jgi:cyclin B
MFMACKYEEIYPFKLKLVIKKIAHNKLTKDQIRNAEKDIFKALDFDISAVTSYDIIMSTLYLLKINEIMSEKYFKYLVKVCLYLAKMNMYDYDLLNG